MVLWGMCVPALFVTQGFRITSASVDSMWKAMYESNQRSNYNNRSF
jgi:hypothetical protein